MVGAVVPFNGDGDECYDGICDAYARFAYARSYRFAYARFAYARFAYARSYRFAYARFAY